jgi:hypothetical protein
VSVAQTAHVLDPLKTLGHVGDGHLLFLLFFYSH